MARNEGDKLPEGTLSVTSLGKKICLSLLWLIRPTGCGIW